MSTLFDTGPQMKVTAIAPWYGSNRTLAPIVGQELRGCTWVGIPFCGGMAEVPHITARSITVSDLHRHIINLAVVVQRDERRAELIERLNKTPFHPDVLNESQAHCRAFEASAREPTTGNVTWAYHYFIACWMGRSGNAGTAGEFNGGLALRWTASGGDSNTRFRSAVESLDSWCEVMRRCNFAVLDVFDFLAACKDQPGIGIYLDPPFPGPGDRYRHPFDERQHHKLAEVLRRFSSARVVCRFYDHPLVRELYPESHWTWRHLVGRDQANNGEKPEVLIINGDSYAKGGV
jgi:DNA adenine methylase